MKTLVLTTILLSAVALTAFAPTVEASGNCTALVSACDGFVCVGGLGERSCVGSYDCYGVQDCDGPPDS